MTDSYSLLPIDVGFDLRLHDMTTEIVYDGREYVFAGDDDEPQTIRAEWANVDTVAETLARAGYAVRVATTDAGQRLECHPQDKAPAGELPSYTWTGPMWAAQTRDGSWCLGPTLDAAIRRAGIRPDELRPLS
jgi:hypothetical protein